MRDPYLYSDVNVLVNRAGIKNAEVLRKAEADITKVWQYHTGAGV